MGNWGLGDYLATVATGGLYGAGKYAYDQTYGKAADEQKAGYTTAGQQEAQLGTNMQNLYQQQGQQALSYFSGGPAYQAYQNGGTGADYLRGGYDYAAANGLPEPSASQPISPDQALIAQAQNRPTQQQDYYSYMQGQAGQLTNQEQLYNERKNGTDPAAAYQDQRAIDQINNQLAARGVYNSGPGVRQISDYEANANAQRSQQLAALAGGADQSRLGLDQAYGSAAQGASGEQSGYFNSLENNAQSLAQAKADTFGHYSDEGSQAYEQGQLGQIQAQLMAQGVDAQTIHEVMSDVFSGLGAGANLITAGKKSSSGQAQSS